MTYETMNIMKCDGIYLDENWFLFIVLFLEALSNTVPHHVVIWVLEWDRCAAELDVDSSRPLSVGLSLSPVPELDRRAAELDVDPSRLLSEGLLSPSFGWVSGCVPVPLLLPFSGCQLACLHLV